MEYTKNLNLKKPDVNEYYDIEKNNENMDLIDTAVGELNKKLTEYKVYYYDSSESLTANSFIHSSIPLELLNGYTIDDIVSINVECTNALWCRITGSIYRPNHIAITNYAIRDCESPKYRITLGFCKVK